MKKEVIIIETDKVQEVKELSRLAGRIPPNKKHKSKRDYKRRKRCQVLKAISEQS